MVKKVYFIIIKLLEEFKIINKELVRKLQNETGYGMLDCKKALQECNWDMDKAKIWLHESMKIWSMTSLITKRPKK